MRPGCHTPLGNDRTMKNFEQDFTLPPFPAFPSASRYVAFGPVLDSVSRVSRSVLAREAISLIIGPPGTGKSLACALLAKEFAATHDVVAIGETSIVDETSFYRFLLHRLGVALENGKRDELELKIHERLCGADANANGAVLIIDEAASLSSEVLEAIRRMTNLMREGQPMVSAIVAGGVKLDETLASPSLEPFVQRVTARCYLHPLNSEETRHYIHQSIEACEASPSETITDGAVSAIHHASAGVPRLINQLMTEAIDCAAEMNEVLIDEHTIDKAWAALQQLPSPMTELPEMRGESSVVEFGELVDPLPMAETPDTVDAIKSQFVAESISRAEQEADADQDLLQEHLDGAAESVAPEAIKQTTDPITLFGEFEDEEHIEVGAAQADPMRNEPAQMDLETMLHSQIVSLSQFAAENTAVRREAFESIQLSGEAEPSDPFGIEAAPARGADSEYPSDYPSVVWYDEPTSAATPSAAGHSDLPVDPSQDDSDLLWITEDIDVERRNIAEMQAKSHRVDHADAADAPRLNVDYREMLEKMRNLA